MHAPNLHDSSTPYLRPLNRLTRLTRLTRPSRAALVLCGLLSANAAWSLDATCKLKYPIVLSHMWSATPICERPTATGTLACENTQDYAKYCAQKSTLADGTRKCLEWRVPDDEADLPPRDYNVNDATLVRNLRSYHRYFSKAIVSRLRDTCGNKVYIADKPPVASYEVRARVLRTTVLQALKETGAAKVNIIGMSMGVQDARYMTAVMPVDLANPTGPKMRTKVASVVSLVGEDGGAETAGLGLAAATAAAAANGNNWSVVPAESQDAIQYIGQSTWKKIGAPMDVPGRLVENCQGAVECDLSSPVTRYRWLLRSLVNLTPAFMRPSLLDSISSPITGWADLRAFTGEPYNQWTDVVPFLAEFANGVRYMNYGAVLRWPNETWGHTEVFLAVSALGGENDSNVSLKRQQFANWAPNFENLKVMRGAAGTTGYHHTFFTGRNDPMYVSMIPAERDPAPYGGTSADFYHQLARDMQLRGL